MSVVVLREDGTVLVASTPATQVSTGIYSYTLSPTETADLDVLEAHWTAVNLDGADQVLTTSAEIVGGFHFTVAEAQALPPLQTFSVDQIVEKRTMAEQALEDVCGAFVPRYARETFNGDSAYGPAIDIRTLLTVRERILRVVSATVDGEVLDPTTLAELVPDRDGVYWPAGWPCGYQNIELKYEHGFKQVPALVHRASLKLCRRYLVEEPVDDRTTRVTQEGATIEFQTDPSLPFDIPEVNAVVARYGQMAVRLT